MADEYVFLVLPQDSSSVSHELRVPVAQAGTRSPTEFSGFSLFLTRVYICPLVALD